jgi:hypothetical protein
VDPVRSIEPRGPAKPAAPDLNGQGSLEFRLRKLHQRRRRAIARQLVKAGLWGAGLLGAGVFVLAIGIEATQR